MLTISSRPKAEVPKLPFYSRPHPLPSANMVAVLAASKLPRLPVAIVGSRFQEVYNEMEMTKRRKEEGKTDNVTQSRKEMENEALLHEKINEHPALRALVTCRLFAFKCTWISGILSSGPGFEKCFYELVRILAQCGEPLNIHVRIEGRVGTNLTS